MRDAVAGLDAVMAADRVSFDVGTLAAYARDQADGAPFTMPDAVVRPRTTAEVAAVVGYCAENGIPIVPRGAGTGLSGGANATPGCVVLSFEEMNRILRVDRDERLAVVQPGVVNDDLRTACAEQGLWYPPDPASSPWCTIGGNVATGAGGICCVKYGVTRDYVLALEAVMGRGRIVRVGRATAKGVAGYDLVGLLVGSEGTLGAITEVTVRLLPARPPERAVLGYFADLPAAGEAVAAVVRSGVQPSALELVDRGCLRAVDEWKGMGLAEHGEVLLLARCDAPGADGEADAERVLECFRAAGATWSARSADEAEADRLFLARRLVYPALERHGKVLSGDVCVPRMRVPEMLGRIERIGAEHGLAVANLAHAGDGNLHPMVVVPFGDEGAEAEGLEVFEDIADAALELGGTVTGEHGVGLLKRRGLEQEVGADVMEMHRAVKRALDPAGIFNPGKVF